MYYLVYIQYSNGKSHYYAGTKNGRISVCPNPFYGKKYVNKKCAENMKTKLSKMWNKDIKIEVKYVDEHGTIR